MNKTIENIVSLCKQRGFVYQSSDIYGGFGAVYDYGPLGVELKNNIANLWWKEMTRNHENIVGLDSGILMHPKISLTPHIGAATSEAQERIGEELVRQICDYYRK